MTGSKSNGNSNTAPPLEDDVPEQSLDQSMGFLLAETARLTRRLLYGRLASRGIRGGSWYVLRVLWEGDGLTQRELSVRLGMTQPSTLEMLRTMEREKLVRFERDALDKRKTRVLLTPEAWAMKVPLLHLAEETGRIALQRLTKSEEVLLKMLLRVVRDTTIEALAWEQSADSTGPAEVLDLKQEAALALPAKPAAKTTRGPGRPRKNSAA